MLAPLLLASALVSGDLDAPDVKIDYLTPRAFAFVLCNDEEEEKEEEEPIDTTEA